MSDSMDLEQVESLLSNMTNVIRRAETMFGALNAAPRGVDLPRGCDLSGLLNALRCIESIGVGMSSEVKSLVSTVKALNVADQSWGDHVKGWVSTKTGHHWLDRATGTVGSVAAGATDFGHDFGAGVVTFAWDIADIPGDISAYQHGDVMPIQKPGLGFINIAVNPGDAGRALIGWQYHKDPLRMGTYAIGNILTMIATGGAGEAAEGTLASRLAKLTAEGDETASSLSRAIEDLEEKRSNLPSSRQRRPGKRDWVISKKRDLTRQIDDLRKELADHETHMSNVKDRYNALANVRHNTWVTRFGDWSGLKVPYIVNKVANWIRRNPKPVDEFAKGVWDKYVELQQIVTAGLEYSESKEARRRLAEFAEEHAKGLTWPTP